MKLTNIQMVKDVVSLFRNRAVTLVNLADDIKDFCSVCERSYDPDLLLAKGQSKEDCNKVLKTLEQSWLIKNTYQTERQTKEKIADELDTLAVSNGWERGEVFHPLRIALFGQKNSPSPQEALTFLDYTEVLKRIQYAQKLIA